MEKTNKIINQDHRCSGGNNCGQVSKEAIERAQHGWDDREMVETTPDTEKVVKEEELSSHF